MLSRLAPTRWQDTVLTRPSPLLRYLVRGIGPKVDVLEMGRTLPCRAKTMLVTIRPILGGSIMSALWTRGKPGDLSHPEGSRGSSEGSIG